MHGEIWSTLVEWLGEGRACALATVVRTEGSAPREPGAKMVLRADGVARGTVGGGALELAVTRAALEVLAEGKPRLLSYQLKRDLGMACGGAAEVFVEPLLPGERLYLFGAGHIGRSLSPLAQRLGFAVTVIDDRAELLREELLPGAQLVLGFDAAAWGALPFDQRTYCVVVSPGHETDTALVRELMTRPFRYLGMIGSTRKRRAVEAALRDAGVAEERASLLRSPIGEPIGADTPEEIAVSIAAELVRVRRSAPSPHLDGAGCKTDTPKQE